MHLSLSTWLWDHLDAEAMAAHVAAAGFETVEVSGARWPEIWPEGELLPALARHGLTIASVHASDHEHTWTDEGAWREFQARWYAGLDGFPGGAVIVQHTSMAADDLDRELARLNYVCELAVPRGLRVAIENLPRAETRATQIETLRRQLHGAPVGLTLDGLHAVSIGLDPLAIIDALGDRLINIHVLDWDGQLPLGDWLPPGRGKVDWPAIIARLRAIGYDGPLTVELNEARPRRFAEAVSSFAPEVARAMDGFEDAAARYSHRYLSELIHR